MRPLVSVIIPAHNAEATLHETLLSVRAQTYANLEIIVVDDGSTDRTAAIVEGHAADDPRVRLIRHDNGGVAAARNRAIAAAKGDFVAPVDADDLWAPCKIELQMALMRDNPDVGLVYTWQARIDGQGRVLSTGQRPMNEGRVLLGMLRCNLVGSGSPALMRKAAVIEAGGYDSSLRAMNAEGCEDLKLYRLIAERHDFALVPAFLTGYRKRSGTMSEDIRQMLRSHDLVDDFFRSRHPGLSAVIDEGATHYRIGLIAKTLRRRDWATGWFVLRQLLARFPGRTVRLAFTSPLQIVPRVGGRLRRSLANGPDPAAFLALHNADPPWAEGAYGAPARKCEPHKRARPNGQT